MRAFLHSGLRRINQLISIRPMPRCDWCKGDPLYIRYHDEEWGVPLREETRFFEFLLLEGAQAGLSWITVLKKREGYRRAFENFAVEKIAAFSDRQLDAILQDSGIIRNRRKVYAARQNARATLALYEQGGSLLDLFWGYVDGVPIQNAWEHIQEVPAHTPLAEQLSKDLRKLGFSFVGPTIVYAHMQATGMVNDHLVSCPRRVECAALA